MNEYNSSVKQLGAFTTLQAATEIKFALLTLSFVLFVDNIFSYLNGPGILILTTLPSPINTSGLAVKIFLTFILYSFTISLITPTLSKLCIEFHYSLIYPLLSYLKLINHDKPASRPYNCVTTYELQKAAHENKDKFLLSIYEKVENRKKEYIQNTRKQVQYATFCLFNLCWNFLLSFNHKTSITSCVSNYLGSHLIVLITSFGLFSFISFFLESEPEKWIYCPSIYRLKNKPQKPSTYYSIKCN